MRQLGIFAKFWSPGGVKTRLAADIGIFAASRLYRVFLHSLLTGLSGAGQRREVIYAPRPRRRAFAAMLRSLPACPRDPRSAWQLVPQGTGDLGERLQGYFARSFARGAERVVVLGSDSPTLSAVTVERAFECLRHHPVVLGPTYDGGYYLVGARQSVPPIFDGIAWSTPRVWRQTVQRLRDTGVSFAELAPWYDVDELADLRRLGEELRVAPPIGRLHRLRVEVDRVLNESVA